MNNDLISREALINEFKARCICNCDRCKYQKGAYCGLIDNAPTIDRPQGEWIPVSERLPDYMEYTLVTIQVNNREPKVRSGFYAHGCFHNDNGDTWNWNDPEIKAWMPLPEPYKEAENDE